MTGHYTIILRTVCGCERMIAIPNRTLPYEWRVAYIQKPYFTLTTDETAGISGTQGFKIRRFERTTLTGNYGYPIYLEKLDA
jgi:hypothetical protein